MFDRLTGSLSNKNRVTLKTLTILFKDLKSNLNYTKKYR